MELPPAMTHLETRARRHVICLKESELKNTGHIAMPRTQTQTALYHLWDSTNLTETMYLTWILTTKQCKPRKIQYLLPSYTARTEALKKISKLNKRGSTT